MLLFFSRDMKVSLFHCKNSVDKAKKKTFSPKAHNFWVKPIFKNWARINPTHFTTVVFLIILFSNKLFAKKI